MRSAGERIPAGDRIPPRPLPPRAGDKLSLKTPGLGFSWKGGADFQPLSLPGEPLWRGTTLHIFFFFFSSFWLAF